MQDTTVRPDDAIDAARAARGGPWRLVRWIHRRRPVLTFVITLAAPAYTLLSGTRPVDLLRPEADARHLVPWALMLFGVAVRVWGSGNLRKNEEVTRAGIYQMVRHPLYLGSLSMFLAYFLTVTEPALGGALFLLLVFGVYYPTMMGEEEFLALKFPRQYAGASAPPRLLPDPRRLGEALRTDRFSLEKAWGNLGLRSLWFLVALPAALKLLIWVQSRL